MNNLRLEILEKRKKLEELKQRKRERVQKAQEESSTLKLKRETNFEKRFENLTPDEIVAEIFGHTNTSSATISVSSSGQSLRSNLSCPSFPNSNSYSSFKCFNTSCNSNENSINEKLQKLQLSSTKNLNIVDIFPNETIKYSKETQTITDNNLNESEQNDDGLHNDANEKLTKTSDRNHSTNKKDKLSKQKPLAYYDDIFVYDTFQWEDEFSANDLLEHELLNNENIDSLIKKALSSHDLENVLQIENNKTSVKSVNGKKDLHLQAQISDENDEEDYSLETSKLDSDRSIKKPLNNDEFVQFLKQKRPIIERALRQNEKNIFFDYSTLNTIEKVNDDSNSCIIKLKKSFCSADKSAIVTCLDWSHHYPEYLLCSYDNMLFNYEEAASESLAVLWNLKMDQKTPYMHLSCSSLITSCIFSTYHPNLIISGTYSGQIVMWDIRVNKRTPIQRSSLSTSSHMNPVYCVQVIGTQDANNLISISNDGKLCTWSLDNLNLPFETQDLYVKNASNKSVYATCFDFQNIVSTFDNDSKSKNETNSNLFTNRYAVIGAEDGLVHSLTINNNTNSNNNKFTTLDTFNDHLGPITSVSCYSQFSNLTESINSYVSQLFLTSSFDGCIKLWHTSDSTHPIHSFECNGDYVYDVSWSPTHPALFACVDGTGKLDIWNLNKDFELPSATFELDNRTRALNRLKWSKNGHEIAVGDDHGQITIFELNENFIRPSVDESNKLMNTLNTLKQINYDSMKTDKNYLSDTYKALL